MLNMRNYFIHLRWALVLACFAMCTSLISCNPGKAIHNTDTLPPLSGEYQGYRLSITQLKVKKKKSKSASIEYTLINTGRNDIEIFKSARNDFPLQIEFDHSLQSAELSPCKSQIIAGILHQDLNIRSGQTLKDRNLKISTKAVDKKEEDSAFTIEVGQGSSSSSDRYFDKNYCPDLFIDSIRIVKLTKKWVTVEYTIKNTGKGPASFSGDTDDESDNITVRAHLSGSKRLSRGAVVIGGTVISDRDILEAGDTYIGIFRIDIRKKTRYTSNLILELDPYAAVRECDETNNQRSIVVE